jgi:hypothetical protein
MTGAARIGDGDLTGSAASTPRIFNAGGEARTTELSCAAVVKLSGGRGSTCGTEDSKAGALETEESINFSEPLALSVLTKVWDAVVVGGISLCNRGCACGLELSSLPRSGGAGAGGTGSAERVINA